MDRRTFLSGAAVVAAGAASACSQENGAQSAPAAPAVNRNRTRRLRMVTTWPTGFPGLGSAAERTAQMCNDAALFLREWERSDPHEAKAGVGAALRTLLVSHEFLAMLRAIGAGDTRTLEALGRLDFLPPNPAAVEEHRAAFRGLGVPVFALHRALPFVLEGAMRVLHAHYGALKAAADWPRLPELRERAEALMGFAGASSALGMHYGSTGDSNRKMVQMLADMA